MKSVILSVCVHCSAPMRRDLGGFEREKIRTPGESFASRLTKTCRPCRENASIARWVAVIQAQVQTAANYKTKPSIKSLMPVRCLKNRKFRTPALIGARQGYLVRALPRGQSLRRLLAAHARRLPRLSGPGHPQHAGRDRDYPDALGVPPPPRTGWPPVTNIRRRK
jgi:hypothetical protein